MIFGRLIFHERYYYLLIFIIKSLTIKIESKMILYWVDSKVGIYNKRGEGLGLSLSLSLCLNLTQKRDDKNGMKRTRRFFSSDFSLFKEFLDSVKDCL
jgi:hypothetical protein